MRSVIEVNDLHHHSGGRRLLRGVSFQVLAGEFFALLGLNGSGKTTVMEILSGRRSASGGTVRVLGTDPHTGWESLQQRVGVLRQVPAPLPDVTVGEVVTLRSKVTARSRPVAEALELVDLTDEAASPVNRISGGQRRRLELTLALLGKPELLLLDEPTLGLDPLARQATWRLLRRLVTDNGTSVLLTTRPIWEARHLTDRLSVIDRGRIIRTGHLPELVERYSGCIVFRLPSGVPPGDLPTLAGVDMHESAGWVILHAKDPQQTMLDLLLWMKVRGLTPADLELRNIHESCLEAEPPCRLIR